MLVSSFLYVGSSLSNSQPELAASRDVILFLSASPTSADMEYNMNPLKPAYLCNSILLYFYLAEDMDGCRSSPRSIVVTLEGKVIFLKAFVSLN